MFRLGNLRLVAAWCVLILSGLCNPSDSRSHAQYSSLESWEVGKVFVREDEQGRQIPSDFWPIEIGELDKRLNEIRRMRMQRALNPAFLEQATYLALLQRDFLVSEKSCWQLHNGGGGAPAVLDGVSFVLTDARNLADSCIPLSSANMRFRADGKLELVADSQSGTRWFGFENVGVHEGGVTKFELRVPPALLGKMLLVADATLELSSIDAVVERIEQPNTYLPDDWGDITLPAVPATGSNLSSLVQSSSNGQLQWWLVRLSGVSNFTLEVLPKSQVGSTQLNHALRKSEINYTLDDRQVSVSAAFEPLGSSRQPMMVQLHSSLRLVEALGDGRVLDWKLVESTNESSLFQLAVDPSKLPTKIEIQAVGRFPMQLDSSSSLPSWEFALPNVEIVNSHTLQGLTSVTAKSLCRVTQVTSEVDFVPSHPSFSIPTDSSSEELSNDASSLEWSGRWAGRPPTADVRLVKKSSEWLLDGLTRLSVREESITVLSNIRFAGTSLESNSLLLPVSSYWIVESAEIVGDLERLFDLRLRSAPDGKQQVEINWQHAADSVQFQLEVLARRPNDTTDQQLVIEQSMSISAPDSTCWMNYVVEENDKYHLRSSPHLIQMSISKQELPTWQQGLVSETSQIMFRDSSSGFRLFHFDFQGSEQSRSLANGELQGDIDRHAIDNQQIASEPDSDNTLPSNPSSWIWSETLIHRFFDSGQVSHELNLVLQSHRESKLSIDAPDDWNLEGILIDGQVSESYRWQPGLLELPSGLQGRRQLRIRWTSEEMPFNWFNKLAIRAPVYNMPLMKRLQTVWISPKSCFLSRTRLIPNLSFESLSDSTAVSNVAGNRDSEHWLSLSDIQRVSGAHDGEQWEFAEVKPISNGMASEESLWIVNRNTLLTLTWALLAMLSVISWILLRRSLHIWWGLLILTVACNYLLSEQYLSVSKLILLSLILGCLCRVVERIVQSTRSSASDLFGSRQAMTTGTLFLVATSCSDCGLAQPTAQAESRNTRSIATYAVFIPSDSEHQPVGEYAYIPKQLRDLLYLDNSLTAESETGYILSANYAIRLGQRERDSDVVQSCSVEMRILLNQANSEILIPIKGRGLVWTGIPLLNGQARVWGGRNFSLASDGSGIRFRADAAGEIELKLEFKPEVVEGSDQRYRLGVDIPVVATSKLRVITAGGVSNLSINSKGLVQRTFLGDTIANIGPLDRLDISWTFSQRSTNIAPAEQVSETWMLSQADKIVAGCQLTVQRGQALPREMDLIINGDWQPIGDSWKDVELIGMTSSGTQARTVCRVRQKETARDSCTIQLLLVPKQKLDSTRLSVPFIALDRVNSKATYFWWSSDSMSKWVPEVSEIQPVRNESMPNWGAFSLAPQRVGYQIFGATVFIRQQVALAPIMPLSEVNSLRLRRNQTVITYVANWEPTGNQPERIVLNLPESPMDPELEINGVPAKFRLDTNRRSMQISMKDNGIGRLGRLKVAINLPTLQNQIQAVPRISISGALARQSLYEIYQGLGMSVRVMKQTQDIAFAPADKSAANVGSLDELDLRLGDFDLSQRPTQDGYFTLSLNINQADDPPPVSEVLYLDLGTNVWQATFQSVWSDSQEVPSFAFFDLPLMARDGLTASKTAFKFIPHSNPSRTNLCVPIIIETGQPPWVEFSIPLQESSSSRVVSLPQIHAIGRSRTALLGLPRSVNGTPIEWQGVTRYEADFRQSFTGPTSRDDYDYYSIGSEVMAVTWHPVNEQPQQSRLLSALVDVSDRTVDQLSGIVHYWMEVGPSDELYFDVPEDCSVLGVFSGGRDLPWKLKDSQLVIRAPKGKLPCNLQVVAEWTLIDSKSIKVPTIGGKLERGSVFLFPPNDAQWKLVSGQLAGTDQSSEELANRWARTIVAAAQTLSNTPSDETVVWMSHWYPPLVGISNNQVITDSRVMEDSVSVDLNSDGALTAEELWRGLDMVVEPTTINITKASQTIPAIQNRAPIQLVADEFILEQDTPSVQRSSVRQSATATSDWTLMILSALAVISAIAWFFEERLIQFVSNPGVHWLMLSVLLGIVTSLYWLSLLVALVGGWQIISHFVFLRHRVQRI